MATKKTTTAKKTSATKKTETTKKPYVNYSTIWNSVGGGFSNAGESHVVNVGKHKVLVKRSDRLDRYGNPIHTATVINDDGSLGSSYRSTGNASLVVSKALEKSGVETHYKRNPPKKK